MLFSIPVANMKLAIVRLPMSAREERFGHAPNARPRHEEPTGPGLGGKPVSGEAAAGRGDVQAIEIRAAECATRDLLRRDRKLRDLLPCRRKAANAPAGPE